MSETRFYHLERQTLEQALPGLLEKAYQGGHKIVVKTPDEKTAEDLNALLWTYNPGSFLPHGTKKDGQAENQPVWITDKDENPNKADVLILTNGVQSEIQEQFSLRCEIFNGRDEAMLKKARENWKAYKEAGHTLTYWQQGAQGWEKKEI